MGLRVPGEPAFSARRAKLRPYTSICSWKTRRGRQSGSCLQLDEASLIAKSKHHASATRAESRLELRRTHLDLSAVTTCRVFALKQSRPSSAETAIVDLRPGGS